MGSGGAPGIGGVAPGVYVDARGDDVPVGMPDEIMLRGGTPFCPVGTDAGEDGDEFVEELLLPVEMEEVVEEERVGVLAGGEDGDEEDEPERVLVVATAASSAWRR